MVPLNIRLDSGVIDTEAGCGWHLGTLGMRTNPEPQPIRAPRRVDFSAKKQQGGQIELVSSSEYGITSFYDNSTGSTAQVRFLTCGGLNIDASSNVSGPQESWRPMHLSNFVDRELESIK